MTSITCDNMSCTANRCTLHDLVVVRVGSDNLETIRDRYQSQKSQQLTYGVSDLCRRKAQFRLEFLRQFI